MYRYFKSPMLPHMCSHLTFVFKQIMLFSPSRTRCPFLLLNAIHDTAPAICLKKISFEVRAPCRPVAPPLRITPQGHVASSGGFHGEFPPKEAMCPCGIAHSRGATGWHRAHTRRFFRHTADAVSQIYFKRILKRYECTLLM